VEDSAGGTVVSVPIGRAGRLEAHPLEAAGDHAVLVRETGANGRRRALLTTDKLPTGERLVVMPLDDEVEVRVDGDALAVWLGSGILDDRAGPSSDKTQAAIATEVPPWASIIGGALLIAVLAFALIGSAVVFGWLTGAFA